MKRVVLVGALLLAGCATGGDVIAQAKQIQNNIRLACSFVPTLASIAALISSNTATASGIVNSVCSAVSTAPLADGPGERVWIVNGVRVKGSFVRR